MGLSNGPTYPEMFFLDKVGFRLGKDVWPKKTEFSTVNSSTDWRCLRSIKDIETSSILIYAYHALSLGSPNKNKQLKIDVVMARFSLNNQALYHPSSFPPVCPPNQAPSQGEQKHAAKTTPQNVTSLREIPGRWIFGSFVWIMKTTGNDPGSCPAG